MVTASHNPEADNGVKLADPDGGMLASDWERHAVDLANADSDDAAIDLVKSLCRTFAWFGPFSTSIGDSEAGGLRRMVVHIGRDTRPHSPPLAALTIRAARSLGCAVIDHGVVTTPQLHHAVMHANPHRLPNVTPQRADEAGYMETVCGSYVALIRTAVSGVDTDSLRKRRTLLVDCACGVGAPKAAAIQEALQRIRADGSCVNLAIANRPGDGPLNEGCGAEFVQKRRLRPTLYGEEWSGTKIMYGASLDGDADRVIFHYDQRGGGGVFRLLDGDKIAVLVTDFVQEELRYLQGYGVGSDICCGVVQTAYANGSSTAFLRDVVKTNVAIAKTGVKFVHAAAHDNFDVGIYFEANGHGTVLFGPRFHRMLSDAESKLRGSGKQDRANVAWQRLRALPGLVNQAVGDALSDMLLVDVILYLRGWTIKMWDGLFEDMPSRQCKVKVQDRSIITTNENETKALTPQPLQPALDAAMAAMSHRIGSKTSPPRCFVRPSGTEDTVRVYAEASTQRDADTLSAEAAALVHRLCDGVGEPPVGMVRTRL